MACVSCIKDVPLRVQTGNAGKNDDFDSKDTLKAAKYAEALSKFIKHADTPVTIGIQGGWGSGKTSLFSIIQSYLAKDKADAPLCVSVNAWEHSLFQEKQGKSVVVLSILTSIIDAIQETVKDSPDLDKAKKSYIEEVVAPKIKQTFHALGKCMPSLISTAIGVMTGTTPTAQERKEDEGVQAIPRLADQIRSLRQDLVSLAAHIVRGEKLVKTVIFIDDLDRVQPSTAVEILDVIKNIFDIENCVFVLAIDYEVVVKGLESKFGVRGKDNEREFRQYFDKIIQVPFSMPVGSYSREMAALLEQAFKSLEIYRGATPDKKVLEKLASVSKLATGGNPRSIKRLLNTLSLLQYMADEAEVNLSDEQKALYLQIRFIIIALHLNFPEISRRLMENNKFTSWKLKELDTPWDLNLKDREADLEALKNSPELQVYFDEDWEKTVFCLCAQTEWLKRKAWNVSRMMNMLRVTLNRLDNKEREDELKAEPLNDIAMEALSRILDSIAVVSIDSGADNSREKLKYDAISRNMKALHKALWEGPLAEDLKKPTEEEYAAQDELDESRRVYQMEGARGDIPRLALSQSTEDGKTELALNLVCANHGFSKSVAQPELRKKQDELEKDDIFLEWLLPDHPDDEFFTLRFSLYADQDSLAKTGELAGKIAAWYKMAPDLISLIRKA